MNRYFLLMLMAGLLFFLPVTSRAAFVQSQTKATTAVPAAVPKHGSRMYQRLNAASLKVQQFLTRKVYPKLGIKNPQLEGENGIFLSAAAFALPVLGLAAAIAGFPLALLIGGVGGVVLGIMAISNKSKGKGLALAGLILGGLELLSIVVVALGVFFLFLLLLGL